jgi:recombination protein RecA
MAKASMLDRFMQSASVEPDRYYIPFSLPSLNAALDNPQGLQCGRMCEIIGTESTGKSTLALDLIKNAQALDMPCHYADVERTFDKAYAQTLGVDCDKLQIIRADTAENTLSLVEQVARQGSRLVIIDSITFLVPQSHNEDSVEDEDAVPDYMKSKKMAALGTLLTDFCKRMTPIADYHNTLIIFINQYRANFSTMSRVEKKPYGPYAYKHALTWRLELARVENKEQKTTVECKITKNKLGVERKMTRYDIVYGEGLDIKGDILTCAVNSGIVQQKGSWFVYGEQRAQGATQAKELFDFNELRKQL